MAGFQRRVGSPKPGLPGTPLNPSSLAISVANYQFDGTLRPGDFAFMAASDNGRAFRLASKTGTRLLGMVVSVMGEITITARGAIYADVPEGQTPSNGQAVLCDPATGVVTYGKAGDPNDTGWDVVFLPRQFNVQGGDMVIYQNLGTRTPNQS